MRSTRRAAPGRLCWLVAAAAVACLCMLSVAPASVGGDYVAAVVQHVVPSSLPASSTPAQTKAANLAVYARVALAARAAGAQVLTFPEFGLIGHEDLGKRATTAGYAEPVPDWTPQAPAVTPCDHPEKYANSPTVYHGSCMSRNASLPTLINLFESLPCASAGAATHLRKACPSDGQYVYNTDVLFDERGALVAKYRKAHPAFIFSVDAPPKAETVTYRSRFNVTFGLFICFDIAFQSPAVDLVQMGVRDFLYAAAIGGVGRDTVAKLWSYTHKSQLLLANMGANCSDIIVAGTPAPSTVIQVDGTEDSFLIARVPADN